MMAADEDTDGHLSFTTSPSRTGDGDASASSCFDLSTFTKEIDDWMKSKDPRDEPYVQPADHHLTGPEFVATSSPLPPPSDIRYSFSMTDEKLSTISSFYPGEPDPVRSPPFQAFTTSSMPSLGTTPLTTPGRVREVDSVPSLSPTAAAKNEEFSVWEGLIESMRQAMRLQDEQIRALRKENNELRRQLAQHHQRPGRETGKVYNEETAYNEAGSRTKLSRSDLPEPRRDVYPDRVNHKFSPGTKFVAELAQLMDLEVGHFAALSSIMDKRLSSGSPNPNSKLGDDHS